MPLCHLSKKKKNSKRLQAQFPCLNILKNKYNRNLYKFVSTELDHHYSTRFFCAFGGNKLYLDVIHIIFIHK